jgi:hypothetical protein
MSGTAPLSDKCRSRQKPFIALGSRFALERFRNIQPLHCYSWESCIFPRKFFIRKSSCHAGKLIKHRRGAQRVMPLQSGDRFG